MAPGFIDIHNHGDVRILAHPKTLDKIKQGVTTTFIGNLVSTIVTLSAKNRECMKSA